MSATTGKMRYLYQKVAGSRRDPGGVCPGYFKTPIAAARYHDRISGYVRRVRVPADLPVQVWD